MGVKGLRVGWKKKNMQCLKGSRCDVSIVPGFLLGPSAFVQERETTAAV